jgi:hypothetical protein
MEERPHMTLEKLRPMIVEALRRYGCHLDDMFAHDLALPESDVARKIGWLLVKTSGSAFRHGRKMLERAYGGYLLPPPHDLYWTGPSDAEMTAAPFLESWSCVLWQSLDEPAEWQIGGGDLKWKGGHIERRWLSLLHIDTTAELARTTDGWVKLGRRFYS